MKKIFYLLISSVFFMLLSCNNNDSKQITQHEIWAIGYMANSPTSAYEQCSTEFLFYSNKQNTKFVTKAKTGLSIADWINSSDDIYNSLCKDGGIQTEDGQTVYPVKNEFVSSNASSYKVINLPFGSYFVVAVSLVPGDITRSRCSEKYCTKYIEVKDRPIGQEIMLRPVFPCDYSRIGLVDWTDYNEKFTYTWDL